MRVMGLTSPLPDFLVDTPWESLPGKASLESSPWKALPGKLFLVDTPWESLPGKASLESSPWKALPGKLSLERNLLGPGHPVTQGYPGMVA